MIVIDTSVFIDALFRFDERRSDMANEIFEIVQSRKITILEPEIFRLEVIGQLSRRIPRQDAIMIYEKIMEKIRLVDFAVLNEVSFYVCLETGCRTIDAYFIATAKLTNSILITSDRIMAENAKKAGIEAYYLLEEFEEVKKRLQ